MAKPADTYFSPVTRTGLAFVTTAESSGGLTPPQPSFEILAGVERFFENLTAPNQRGRANGRGDIVNPLQAAQVLTDSLFPVTYVAYLPLGIQGAALGGMAKLARRLGTPSS